MGKALIDITILLCLTTLTMKQLTSTLAIMYILCFHMRSMMGIPRLKSQLFRLPIEAILKHSLNPLKVCLPSIVHEFMQQAKAARLFNVSDASLFYAFGPGRCAINSGGCWSETRYGQTISACSDSDISGCRCLHGFRRDGIKCEDIDECKAGLACQCEGCSCKNTWGGYGCKCKGSKLYIMEQDTCIALHGLGDYGYYVTIHAS